MAVRYTAHAREQMGRRSVREDGWKRYSLILTSVIDAMKFSYDPEANAVYISLRDVPYRWGHDLDTERRIDFGDDNKPIGIELLDVSRGVDIRDLPEQDAIAELLRVHGIQVLTPTP